MKHTFSIGLILFLGILVGCRDKTVKSTDLKAEDLARAQGMRWWNVRLPDDLKLGDVISVRYRLADGTTEDTGGVGGNFQPGEIVKVIVWTEKVIDDELTVSLVAEKTTWRAALRNRFKGKNSAPVVPVGGTVEAGQIFFKGSEKGAVIIMSPNLKKGEFGLILHVSKKGEQKPSQSPDEPATVR